MRAFGSRFSFDRTAPFCGLKLGLSGLALLVGAAVVPSMQAQTAPYVLPYNMTTFAGPNAQFTAGAACSPTSSLIALDADGDGCLATQASVNVDPHDIRVDSQGFVYIVDDGASIAVVHRINPYTGLYTIYYGSLQQTKECTSPTGAATTTGAGDGAGDGCVASDGIANSTTTYFTYYPGSNIRGLGFSPSNDLFLSDFSLDAVQKIAGAIYTSGTTFGHLATGIAGKVSAGKGSSGTTNGSYGTSQLKSNRGASADAAGTVYIADSGNNLIRKVVGGTATTSGTSSTVSATNTTPTYITTQGNNVALGTATFVGPEDAQVDVYGNLIIADFGDNLVRAVYHYAAASTTATEPGFFGITSGLVAGNVYTIAGTGAPPKVSSTCPAATTGTANASAYANYSFTNGISNSLPGTSVPLQVRKLGLDAQGNVYIADGCDGVVYFLDAQTGGMHVIAGIYGQGQTAPTTANAAGVCAAATDFVGDGCPGTQASLDPTNMATQPDTQGNLYITDSEGGTNAALARIRKLTNGLNFSATAVGGSVTQGVLIHFAKGDVPATKNAFVVPSSDFSVSGTPTCNTNTSTDNTTDCVVSLTYTPTQPGFETSTLTANSKLGGTVTYRITGIGSTPELAYDPGNTTQLNATVSGSQDVVVDGQGNAYIADTGNNQVLLYSAASGTTTTLIASSAGLKSPKAIALGTDGSLYIADTGNNLIRKYSSSGTLTTIGGGGTVPSVGNICYTGSGANATDSFGDGCPATNAGFNAPSGIAVDGLGNVFVADTGNKIVRVISTNGYVTQLLTNFTTSAGNSSPFAAPAGLAFDVVNSNLIVADKTNSYVYSVNLNTTYPTPLTAPATVVTNPVKIIAGTGAPGYDTNTLATSAQLNAPTGVSVDASGNIYIADTGNNAVRLVTTGGTISTIAGILGSKSGTGTIGSTAPITAYSYTTNSTTNVTTVTLTANNSFTAGTNVTFSGLTTLTFLNNQNLSVQTGPTATQFQVEYAGTIASPPPSSGTETGTASSSSLATATQFSAPAAVAVTPLGNLIIADSGNNRLLYDSRSQISFNFGRVNLNSNSATQTFTAVNVGNSAAPLTQGLTTNPSSTTFSLTGCSTSTLALGSTCALTGQFSPTAAGLQSATYSDTTGSPKYTPLLPSNPSITLIGTGAALTPTSISVVQTVPATGNPQYGASITLQATVTAGTCNLFAPSCVPSGTVTFSIDNVAGAGIPTTPGATSATASESPTGLSVGQHTITCTFTPDSTDNAYYASSSCAQPYLIVTVTQGGSMSVLSYPSGANNQPQFTPVTLSATVTSVPASGVPTGSVTFYSDAAMQNPIGTSPVSATTGIATLSLFVTTDKNGNVIFNNTLLPGTYTLTCQYNPTPPASTSDYTSSACAGVSFTVTGDAASLLLNPIPCAPSQIYQAGTSTPLQGLPCPSLAPSTGTLPTVATAQGSTTDVTLFITPSNTVSGTLSFSCSGLPANSVCTFSPQTLTVSAGTAYPQPFYTDVTLWTDIPPGVTPSKAEMRLPGHTGNGTQFALMLGWPLTLLGFVGLLRYRRVARSRGLTLTALALLMVGSALTLSGCAGPGIYHPNLTPTGTYAVTITVTGPNGLTSSTMVDFTVTQGTAGQE